MRIDPHEYLALPLEVHATLEDVAPHDVWAVDLEGGRQKATVVDVVEFFSNQAGRLSNPFVRWLFGVRRALGDWFGWDQADPAGYRTLLDRLGPDLRSRSIARPETSFGPFHIVYALPDELLAEARNATVHAFTCVVLLPTETGQRMYWAIYVTPVSRWTSVYMAVIDPFRRWIVYPTILKKLQQVWREFS